MNGVIEGDPIFWDLSNGLIEYKLVEINSKYGVTLKRFLENKRITL